MSDIIGLVLIALAGMVGFYIVFSLFTGRSVRQNEEFLRQATLRQNDLHQPLDPQQALTPEQQGSQQPPYPQAGQPASTPSDQPNNDSVPPSV